MKYTLGLLVVIPQFTFACSGSTVSDVFSLVLKIGEILLFPFIIIASVLYIVSSFIPRYKIHTRLWRLKGACAIAGTLYVAVLLLSVLVLSYNLIGINTGGGDKWMPAC